MLNTCSCIHQKLSDSLVFQLKPFTLHGYVICSHLNLIYLLSSLNITLLKFQNLKLGLQLRPLCIQLVYSIKVVLLQSLQVLHSLVLSNIFGNDLIHMGSSSHLEELPEPLSEVKGLIFNLGLLLLGLLILVRVHVLALTLFPILVVIQVIDLLLLLLLKQKLVLLH